MSRTVVWFSCGAASAVAAKLAPDDAVVVYCDTSASEHWDNKRFFRDVEIWIGREIVRIKSDQYKSVDDVFEKTRYMAGIKGARCTVEMKKVPRFDFQEPDDTHIFGLTFDESVRIAKFEKNNPELKLNWILRDFEITKAMCYDMINHAGIKLPAMYGLGFNNNNCIGCVKATSPKYWEKVRKHFPDVFEKRARQSRELGVRLTRVKGVRIFLDELPAAIAADEPQEESIECGVLCATE
jgi:hypothetical protein